MIAGHYFKYDNISSKIYNVMIADMDGSDSSTTINGTFEYTKTDKPINKKFPIFGKELKEPYTFNMTFVSDQSNVPISESNQHSIVGWLFDREYHKLEIFSDEYKDCYFNCYFSEAEKIKGAGDVIGYRCKVTCDGDGAWQREKTLTFSEHISGSYNSDNVSFNTAYSTKYNMIVQGKTKELVDGIKTSKKPCNLVGTKNIYFLNEGTTDSYSNMYLGEELFSFDENIYDSINYLSGEIEKKVEKQFLFPDYDWSYSPQSINQGNGTSVNIIDAQVNSNLIHWTILGNTTQDLSSLVSIEHPSTIKGTSSLHLNQTEYDLSHSLYSIQGQSDAYEFIEGVYVLNNKIKTLNGTEYYVLSDSNDTYQKFRLLLDDKSITNAIYGLCDKFPVISTALGNALSQEGISFDTDKFISIDILKSRITNWSNGWTDAEKKSAFCSFLTTNNITIGYPLASPIRITDQSHAIVMGINNTFQNDNNSNMSVDYVNNKPLLYAKCTSYINGISHCTHFSDGDYLNNWENGAEGIDLVNNCIYLKILKDSAKDIPDLKEWIRNNQVQYITVKNEPFIKNGFLNSFTSNVGINKIHSDTDSVLKVFVYNSIKDIKVVNTSDSYDYMIPNMVKICCGDTGGDISIYNSSDTEDSIIKFSNLASNEIITIDEFGQMQSSTELNRYDNWNGEHLSLVHGENHLITTGDIQSISISYQNIIRIGV